MGRSLLLLLLLMMPANFIHSQEYYWDYYTSETTASPGWWVNIGDSVNLSCSAPGRMYGWLRRKFNFNGSIQERLANCSREEGFCPLGPVGQQHIGEYYCETWPRSDMGISTFKFLWVEDPSPPASLSISPNRSQFFTDESVLFSCEVKENSTGWRVRANKYADISCSSSSTGLHCNHRLSSFDTGVYWCLSRSGNHSNGINITVTSGSLILESPTLAVTEGDVVTLRCRTKTTPSNLTADFYKDGFLIRTESTGELTIPVVGKSDAGFYKCSMSDLGQSPISWLAVSGQAAQCSAPAPLMSLSRLLCHLVVFCPYLLSTILLVSIDTHKPGAMAQPENNQGDDVICDDVVNNVFDDDTVGRVTTVHSF